VSTGCARSVPESWAPSAAQISEDRLHLQFGPIDLLIDVDASSDERQLAHRAAEHAFHGVLESLVSELPTLRRAVDAGASAPTGAVARRMWTACLNHADQFVTPMAAVAGAVADHMLQSIVEAVPTVRRVWVNALWLSSGQQAHLAVCSIDGERSAKVAINHNDRVGGVATSGWAGRSHSFGIADSVTVLSADAASADVAATLIANSVQLPSAELDRLWVSRRPANELQPDSDLGSRPVTVDVASLSELHIKAALRSGLIAAERLLQVAPLRAVFIDCQGHSVSTGELA